MSTAWIQVAGGFHFRGGMDKANAYLARHLLARGDRVTMVGYEVEDALQCANGAHTELVRRPFGSFLLGGPVLARTARRLVATAGRGSTTTRVIVNGGNAALDGVNWVHFVHAAWEGVGSGGPAWYRVRNASTARLARQSEAKAFCSARLLITNSERTRHDVLQNFDVDPAIVHTVYLGADDVRQEVQLARGPDDGRLQALFLGAISFDRRKGLDTLLAAWAALDSDPEWDVDLLVAGGGNALEFYMREVAAAPMRRSVRFIGFRNDVPALLAGSALLVSPARYEPYGLNVQEALLHGVPVIVSQRAGVAERLSGSGQSMLLQDADSVDELVALTRNWRENLTSWRDCAIAVGDTLRATTWDGMAARIVQLSDAAYGN